MVEINDCIVLENTEYLCFHKIEIENHEYLCLITVDEPNKVCFAEEATIDNETKVRIIGDRATKQKIAAALAQNSST